MGQLLILFVLNIHVTPFLHFGLNTKSRQTRKYIQLLPYIYLTLGPPHSTSPHQWVHYLSLTVHQINYTIVENHHFKRCPPPYSFSLLQNYIYTYSLRHFALCSNRPPSQTTLRARFPAQYSPPAPIIQAYIHPFAWNSNGLRLAVYKAPFVCFGKPKGNFQIFVHQNH